MVGRKDAVGNYDETLPKYWPRGNLKVKEYIIDDDPEQAEKQYVQTDTARSSAIRLELIP